MRLRRWDTIIFSASLILAGISLILVMALLVWHLFDQSQVVDAAEDAARKTGLEAAEHIEKRLLEFPSIAQALADDLTSGKLSFDAVEDLTSWKLTFPAVEDRLKRDLLPHRDVRGISAITACFTPEFAPHYSPKYQKNLYCPYSWFNEFNDKKVLKIIYVEDFYDYTKPDDPTTRRLPIAQYGTTVP